MISKTFEAARLLMFFKGLFDCDRLLQDNVVFAVRQKIIVMPEINGIRIQTPVILNCEYKLFHVGNSSMTYGCDMIDSLTGRLLAKHIIKSVHIGLTSRKSKTFPKWFLEKYSDKRKANYTDEFSMERISSVPENCFHIVQTMRYSDLDANGHVNQTTYIRLCMDCATEAAFGGKYRFFDHDLCTYSLKNIEMSYFSECRGGENVKMYTWQDKTDDACLNFIACNGSEKQIFQAKFIFDLDTRRINRFSKI